MCNVSRRARRVLDSLGAVIRGSELEGSPLARPKSVVLSPRESKGSERRRRLAVTQLSRSR